jgi:hypothetical protein
MVKFACSFWKTTMKKSSRISLLLSLSLVLGLDLASSAQVGNQAGSPGNISTNGITMMLYPVVRGADGNQYLVTPSGKQVTIPGLALAANATQVPVYRDNANNFWYTNMNGQQVAVTPQQLEIALQQINAQSQAAMPPQMMPAPQAYYSSNPAYAGGFNGIPYGTPINMEGPGQYSYMDQTGNKQFVSPNPQITPQLNQWQQQFPYGQQPSAAATQSGMPQGAAQPAQGNSSSSHGTSRMEMRQERRAERLEDRSKNQATNAQNDEKYADQKIEDGQTLGTGFDARRAARENRRSKREERRADWLNDQ